MNICEFCFQCPVCSGNKICCSLILARFFDDPNYLCLDAINFLKDNNLSMFLDYGKEK